MSHLTSSCVLLAAVFSMTQAQWSSYKSQRNLPPVPPPPSAQASSFTTKFYEFEQPAPIYSPPPSALYPAQAPMYTPSSNSLEDYSSLIKLVKTLNKSQPEKESSCNTGDIINKLIDALIVAVAGKQPAPAQNRGSDSDD